jgi:hypothetical protein
MLQTRTIRFLVIGALAVATTACRGSSQPAAAPQVAEHALAGLAAQHIIVLPTYAARVMPDLAWNAAVARPGQLQRALDADILAALEERSLQKTWILPPQLVQSYRRNSTYAADPYTLAEEPLRSPSLAVNARLPEPLASQIRTLVALHDEARLVLAPVELRLESAGDGTGRGVLRLVLLDARASNVVWIGQVSSDPAAVFGPAITASVAARLASAVAPQ